jgi:CubicO group peptidase (beta-lactamase class C family)
MTTTVPIAGTCDTKFEKLRDAFAANFDELGEVGAGVCVYVDGERVVDLWGGWADKARTRAWQEDTLVTVYSTTKGMTTVAAHRLVEQGLLDLDAPVATYWPEFAQAGKADIPVHMLLSHRVGLPVVSTKLPDDALYDWDLMTTTLAAQEPFWAPGTRHGYHGITFGWLVGEVVRRITGKSLGTFFRDEVATPLGADFHIGLAAEHDHRVAEVIDAEVTPEMMERRDEMTKLMDPKLVSAQPNIALVPGGHNTEAWRRAEIPAANGHTTAHGIARVYAALAQGGDLDGVHVLSPESIDRATTEQAYGPDAMLAMMSTRFGQGFWLTTKDAPLGKGPRGFGHPGFGGSVGFTDPDARIGFGYCMNQLKAGLTVETTGSRLVDALYDCL